MSEVILCMLLNIATAGTDDLPTTPAAEHDKCGATALYALARLSGVNATLVDVERLVPVGPKGASLADLRDSATALGIETEVLNCAYADDIHKLELPAILHTIRRSSEGHFVVLVSIKSDGYVAVIDGGSSLYYETPLGELLRDWTGYALERVLKLPE